MGKREGEAGTLLAPKVSDVCPAADEPRKKAFN